MKVKHILLTLGLVLSCLVQCQQMRLRKKSKENKSASKEEAQKTVRYYYASSSPSAPLKKEPVERWTLATYYDNYWYSNALRGIVDKQGSKITKREGKKAFDDDPKKVKKRIDHYLDLYKNEIDMSEFIVPEEGFKTFNDWFIRKLKNPAKSRPMAPDPTAIVSPADSKLTIIPNISGNIEVFIKEERFDLPTFLGGNKRLAGEYEGGLMMIFRLAPYDYHRYHYPIDCNVSKEVEIPGKYHSVSPGAYEAGVKPLTSNKRSYEILKPAGPMKKFRDQSVVMAQVGALAVASIVNHFADLRALYKKGEEMGYFQFGGSTLVILFKKGSIEPNEQITKNSASGYETAVKVRETIARWKES